MDQDLWQLNYYYEETVVYLLTSLERKKITTLEMHKDLKKYEAVPG